MNGSTPFEDLKLWFRLMLSGDTRKAMAVNTENAMCQWLSMHLPKRLVYWCHIQAIVESTTGEFSNVNVVELTAMDALKNFSKKHNL